MSEAARRGATGRYTTDGVPHGATSLTPYVAVADVEAAAAFYERAFDARTLELTRARGLAVHAQLDLGNGHLHLELPDPEGGLTGPAAGFALGFYCADVDAVVQRALAGGAELLAPAMEFVSGDRFVAVLDPYGIRWSIMSRVEDLSPAQSAQRVAEWADRGR